MLMMSGSAQAHIDVNKLVVVQTKAAVAAELAAFNVINWRIGDFQKMDITLGGRFPFGKMHKWVHSEEGNNIWVHSEVKSQQGNQTTQMLIDRATGEVKKIIQNGREQQVPNDPIEIIDQESTTITVKAGTFDALKITAKSKQIKKMTIWMNPRDTIMDGMLKADITSNQMPIPMSLELTEFGSKK